MSQPNTPTHPAPATLPVAPAPAPAPSGPRERRVRFGHLALAIALVVIGALGTTTLVALVAVDSEYLAVARDVEYGAPITRDDLVIVRIGNPPGLDPVPAGDIDRVVGNYAALPLAAGSLLTGAHVTNQRHPGPGEVRLGITLRGDRLPAQPVRPGQLLLLVDTGSQGGGSGERAISPQTWQGVLVGVGGDGSSGLLGSGSSRSTTIDVVVPAREAAVIASLAANNHLSVAVLPGQPGN